MMRTTIDLPEDLHQIASSLARDEGITLSQAVARLLRVAIGRKGPVTVETDDLTGLRVLRFGRLITNEDVRALEDEI